MVGRRAMMGLAPLVLAALAGCDALEEEQPEDFGGLLDQAGEIYEGAIGGGITDPAALQPTGSANYQGVIYLNTEIVEGAAEGSYDLAGQMTMTAGFTDDTVTGQATNFVSVDEEDYGGSLLIEDGIIDRAATDGDPAVTADLLGTLTAPGGAAYEVEAGLEADFYGLTYDYVLGSVGGVACAAGTEECTELAGGVAVQR